MLTVNGRFLSAKPTGVQRVASALIAELDRQAADGETEAWRLLRPPGSRSAGLSRLRETVVGGVGGQAWEQGVLARRAQSSVLLNLCNTAPVLHRRNLVMIHDAQVFLSPGSYSPAFRAWYRWLLPQLGRRALRILTVSEFSRRNLVWFGVAEPDRIEVIPNGCDHLASCPVDETVIRRFGLADRPFVVMLSSLQEHKNTAVVLQAFERSELAGMRLVLVGRDDEAAYHRAGRELPRAAVFTGALSDAELRGLLAGAVALACPSLTEGFGLPPLEAMSLGCPAVVAPEGALPEVCGEAAAYADAFDPAEWADALGRLLDPHIRAVRIDLGRRQAARYTWARSGRRLLSTVRSALATEGDLATSI